MTMADDDIRKLGMNELDTVGGGAIFDASEIKGSDPNRPWEVLDDNGNIVVFDGEELRFKTREEAIALAHVVGVSDEQVYWDWVTKRRKFHQDK